MAIDGRYSVVIAQSVNVCCCENEIRDTSPCILRQVGFKYGNQQWVG